MLTWVYLLPAQGVLMLPANRLDIRCHPGSPPHLHYLYYMLPLVRFSVFYMLVFVFILELSKRPFLHSVWMAWMVILSVPLISESAIDPVQVL